MNQKYYIGVHKTDNPFDSYYGSGKAIKNAIKKYSKINFVKEVLFITESKNDAYCKEKELTIEWNIESTYNMRPGGVGGFTKENAFKGLLFVTKDSCKRGGIACRDKKVGVHGFSSEQRKEAGRKGGLERRRRRENGPVVQR